MIKSLFLMTIDKVPSVPYKSLWGASSLKPTKICYLFKYRKPRPIFLKFIITDWFTDNEHWRLMPFMFGQNTKKLIGTNKTLPYCVSFGLGGWIFHPWDRYDSYFDCGAVVVLYWTKIKYISFLFLQHQCSHDEEEKEFVLWPVWKIVVSTRYWSGTSLFPFSSHVVWRGILCSSSCLFC